jgi:hypothetical protein
LYFSGLNNHYAGILKTFLIYIVVAVAAWVSGFGMIWAVVLNAVVFFWIVYGLIDEYHPDNYYVPGMAFILFQLSPVTGTAIIGRLEAVVLSFAVAFAVLLLLPSQHSKNTVRTFIEEGFALSTKLLAAYEEGRQEEKELLQDQLRRMNEKICDEIYLYNYSAFQKQSKMNWYCRFVAMFQVFTVLTDEPNVVEKSEMMKNMLRNFRMLFEENQWDYGSKRLKFRNEKPDIRSFRLRFALRQVIVMTPCMIYGYLCPWGNGFWLAVSVYFMLVPLYENMPSRVKGRITGTLAGVVLCFVLFTLFPTLRAHVIILIIINFIINSSTGYAFTVAYLTCAVLALNITTENIGYTLIERLIYTFGGAGLTVLASRYIFPIRIKPEADFLMEKLKKLREEMANIKQDESEDAEEFRYEKDQLLLQSYLLSRRLRLYNEALSEQEKNTELIQELNEHMLDMSYYLVHHFVGVKAMVRE